MELYTLTVSYGVVTNAISTPTATYVLNQNPYNGTCSVSPLTGYAMKTNFTIDCQYWADFDGNVDRYEYFATYLGNNNPIGLSFDYNGSVTVQLPAGPAYDNYELNLFVAVFDDLNGPTIFYLNETVIVNIDMPLIDGIVSSILTNDLSSAIVSVLSSGSIKDASNNIISLSSTLNVLASESPAKLDNIVKAKTACMSSITAMNVTELSETKVNKKMQLFK